MSEKIYVCLLHLFPGRFRETYGEAALQLFRDRSRDEAGFFLQLRLWTDLLCDAIVSLVREHRRPPAPVACALAAHRQYGIPRFDIVGYEAPGLGSLLLAGVLSLATFGLSCFSIGQRGTSGLPRSYLLRSQTQSSGPRIQRRNPGYTFAAWIQPAINSGKLDASERRRVIDALIRNIRQYYFDRHVAQEIADALLAHEKRGDYDAVVEGEAFAHLLTRQIRDVSHDMHLEVIYSEEVLPDGPREPTPAMLASYRKELEQTNCSIKQVKVLAHNIGYLKIDAFPDVSICQSKIVAAMASLNHADAIIFDLRDNHGGDGNMVSLIAGYLFDHPEFLYDPRTNPTLQSWTQPRSGNKLADKPAYVLTSASTISAAEQFAYDLKMLKRVTVVGETTHGSAHAGVFCRMDDHFGMGIPRLKAINPFSNADLEGTRVVPDAKVKAADALETAKKLAERAETTRPAVYRLR